MLQKDERVQILVFSNQRSCDLPIFIDQKLRKCRVVADSDERIKEVAVIVSQRIQ